ncbi:MAG: Lhr family helicase [Myxococcota bacterium]
MERFAPATRAWFEAAFAGPTPVQQQGWGRILDGEHALLVAPTGSGKTLAAFLAALDRLGRLPEDAEPGVRVLYVSPLKALVYDVERNLRTPRVGIARAAERLGEPFRVPRVAVRTGDTTQKERRLQAKDPAEILVTTPESLYLVLGSKARETLRSVETVVVDEIHALAPTKRGAHLALSLERLARLTRHDPQRVGLSATVRPMDEVARFLGGDRPVSLVDTSARPAIDVQIRVPVEDMTRPDEGDDEDDGPPSGSILAHRAEEAVPEAEKRASVWPAIHPRLLEQILAHRTTIVFVNSRGLCERLAERINDLAALRGIEGELVRAHHGSVAHRQRREVEEMLKDGRIRGIVATSSLELGIDMGAVDLVLLVESPGSVASGLQRVGRAGHHVGEVSKGRVYPKHRGDLLEAAVVVHQMAEGEIEPLRVPRNPLDVLAQQIVAATAADTWTVDDLHAAVRRAAPYAELARGVLVGVLDMLSGLYPSSEFADLRPRILWDRETGELTGRRGAKSLAAMSGGTIPDRGLYGVHLGPDGPRVGELDEEMVHESRPGQTFMLGATTWRIEEITRDRVVVSPAPGEPGKLPFWHGEGPGRPVELGRAIGAFVRELDARDDPESRLQEAWRLDLLAARNLAAYVREQREATGTVPTDRAITVERFRDELGDWRVCILSPFGARVHAPWALAIEARLSARAGFDVQTMWTDDGIVIRLVEADAAPDEDLLIPDPEEIEDLVVDQLGHSSLFASQFRENAARALLLPRRRPGSRTPLWAQRMKAQNLLAVARQHPSFPIVLETYRSCLQDVFDLPALRALLHAIRRREVHVEPVETPSASPFARSLVFAFVATHIYDGDAPLAERRAQALALDRNMLRELLGHEELRELLDAGVLHRLEAELQHLAEDRRARHPDGLHDVLRRLGDLTAEEATARCEADDAGPWLEELRRSRRAIPLQVAGEDRWIAIEDAALYRDALGAQPPHGVPDAFLAPAEAPLEQLALRWARTHGPFVTRHPATRWGLPASRVDAVLRRLEADDRLMHGDFRPGGHEREWCDPEVLRRVRQRTLARLRSEVAPVEPEVLARFLPAWHGIGEDHRGPDRLHEAVARLEGLPLGFRDLEHAVLPARVPDFHPRMLDEMGAMGLVVWIGHGALGRKDGRVALHRRERAGLLVDRPGPFEPPSPLHARIMEHLEQRGASFFTELLLACDRPREEDLLEAIWDLVWAGRVTNDTFQPLRALGARRGRGRRGGSRIARAAGGRWSRVEDVLGPPPSPTEVAHARATTLLERHGVLTREAVAMEDLPGGFAGVYPVLKAMEESGRIRRGYFVEGLGGAQFAWPGAVDRLRAARREPDEAGVSVLAATDPANPYGVLIPWPETGPEAAGKPRRAAGCRIVLVDDEPVLYLEKGGRSLLTFPAAADEGKLLPAARALREVARHRRGRLLHIERIDGEPARSTPWADRLREADFTADHRGLMLEAR